MTMDDAEQLEKIKRAVQNAQYVYSLHAVDQSVLRRIQRTELETAISNGEIIERYPDDKYGSSCLIYGQTQNERPLHIVCTMPSKPRKLVKIITVYEPNPDEWIEYKQRK